MPRYLVIGGVAGGATAAARLRRLDEKADIIIYERGGHVSYANCGLPYYLGDVIRDRNRLFVQTAAGFKNRFNIEARVGAEVISINRGEKSILVKDLAAGEVSAISYDKLVLSPGAEPVKPPIPGIDADGIFTLRNVIDTDRIKKHLVEKKPKKALVVGGGFIGLEMAENLHGLGIGVTVVEMADQVMANLDREMASEVHQQLTSQGVELILKDGVSSFEKSGNEIVTRLSSGREISSGMVILSIGVRPDTKLAKEAGLALGPRGGIAVNEFLQTSDPDIYAVGDAIEFMHPLTKQPVITFLAGPANKQGRIAADNIVGGNTKKYCGSIATAVAKIFSLTVASTGANEKMLKVSGIPYLASITHSASHATYYPGATQMSVKILFSPSDGTLYGAQIAGYDGVDKRIDVFSSVIGRGGSVRDLIEFDHAYAPPYSSAKDPVNIAGFTAENILDGLTRTIHWHEIGGLDPTSAMLIDVRTAGEFKTGTIPGAINIPVDELRSRLGDLPRDKKIVIFCAVGLRGHVAARMMLQSGFDDVRNLAGGYKTYSLAVNNIPGTVGACC
ncbi:MAG TPA: FAD-dependent oxidoreductase [Spirochaetota bacterium]|nr:FAD-dependent oxidoreductase [Spirochaetota bacterium]HRS75736.1 FAD-dependent oxidoreductase [Spirochaetota bacterium]HRT73616.1 FAD-dependent oxidoreductase [Spirochaetota bacterium]